ncbi:MAG: ATP-binding cassette domain-containing protein [Anaeroplasmataceae bacterium]
MLKIRGVSKIYTTKTKESITALRDICFNVGCNGLFFVLGESGSGKTTLLNIIGGLDVPNTGSIYVNDLEVGKDITLEKYRQNYVGFVFQEYNLIKHLSVFDNIALAIKERNNKNLKRKVIEVLEAVDLIGYEKRRIEELSGGQKQRVAIARALAKNSSILLCDEPTGNLDSKTSEEIFKLLKKISQDKIVIVISHNEEMATKYGDRIIKIKDGSIISDTLYSKKIEPMVSIESDNKISFRYKIKLGFENLVTHKFKTFISFALLFLSLFLTCIMQICITYNPEKAISKSINSDTIYVVKSASNNELQTYNKGYFNKEVENILDEKLYRKGYKSNHGVIFTINDELEEKEFYVKKDLEPGYAYITDYYVDIKINLSNHYSHLEYSNYNELIDKEVIYNSTLLFKIAGVIKTDYKDHFDDRGNEKEDIEDDFSSHALFNAYISAKKDYEYDILYTTKNTFLNMELGVDSKYINTNEEKEISITETNYTVKMNSLSIFKNYSGNYFDNSGLYKDTTKNPLKDNEIIISQDLYDLVFGTKLNWENFIYQYFLGIENENPYENQLLNIGKEISVEYYDDRNVEVMNLKIVGVTSDISLDKTYSIYGAFDRFGYTNETLLKNKVDEILYNKISNKTKLLEELSRQNILVCGSVATSIYDINNILRPMLLFFVVVLIVLTIITIISIINLVLIKIKDKEKEIGILMGIGFKSKEISIIYLFSIAFMIIVAFVLSIGLIYLIVYIVNKLLQEISNVWITYFSVDFFTYLSILGAGIIIIFISSIPLIFLAKKKPVDIIKKY